MISLFKKTVLTVAMLGCAFGAQAEEKKTPTSTLKSALASAGAVAGGVLLGAVVFADCGPILSSKEKLILGATFALGTTLVSASGLYLMNLTEDIKAKIQSLLGSTHLIMSGAVTCLAAMILNDLVGAGDCFKSSYNFKSGLFITGGLGLLAAALIVSGYSLQPKETIQDDTFDLEDVIVENDNQ